MDNASNVKIYLVLILLVSAGLLAAFASINIY